MRVTGIRFEGGPADGIRIERRYDHCWPFAWTWPCGCLMWTDAHIPDPGAPQGQHAWRHEQPGAMYKFSRTEDAMWVYVFADPNDPLEPWLCISQQEGAPVEWQQVRPVRELQPA